MTFYIIYNNSAGRIAYRRFDTFKARTITVESQFEKTAIQLYGIAIRPDTTVQTTVGPEKNRHCYSKNKKETAKSKSVHDGRIAGNRQKPVMVAVKNGIFITCGNRQKNAYIKCRI
jgi:hypothetical protein